MIKVILFVLINNVLSAITIIESQICDYSMEDWIYLQQIWLNPVHKGALIRFKINGRFLRSLSKIAFQDVYVIASRKFSITSGW